MVINFILFLGSLESTEFVYEHKLQYQETGDDSKTAEETAAVDSKGDNFQEKKWEGEKNIWRERKRKWVYY